MENRATSIKSPFFIYGKSSWLLYQWAMVHRFNSYVFNIQRGTRTKTCENQSSLGKIPWVSLENSWTTFVEQNIHLSWFNVFLSPFWLMGLTPNDPTRKSLNTQLPWAFAALNLSRRPDWVEVERLTSQGKEVDIWVAKMMLAGI